MEHYYALILAGGGGTRLWPISRSHNPKQFLPLVENNSMFKVSVDRLAPLFTPDQIYVVTAGQYIERMRNEVPEIPAANYITEPYGKNSGPAAALGLAVIQKRDPLATVAILTADHHIVKKEQFRQVLAAAYDMAQEEYVVTLGISPSFPSTGFGYIRQGVAIRQANGFSCYHSRGFTEKPDIVTATDFVASGDYSWNSGMFIWTVKQAMAEFKRQQPVIYQQMIDVVEHLDSSEFDSRLLEAWEKLPNISIDFGVMENAQSMAVIPVDIGWSDIGSWSAMFDVLAADRFGNCFKGGTPDHRVILDTHNTLVYSDRLTVTIGIDDMIVVDTEDVLLICHKDRAQDVKEVVANLKKKKLEKYL
ncbi:MAG: mannose-1-phosphate guanylyltransferase [Chloroflexi bacterium]|nr:mannose-1-phosphate guanylyltransferase [Chloroflexota bacterium]